METVSKEIDPIGLVTQLAHTVVRASQTSAELAKQVLTLATAVKELEARLARLEKRPWWKTVL